MRVVATKTIGRELKPGELFSTVGQAYWDNHRDPNAIGEKVYIRTDAPADSSPDADDEIYRITIEPGPQIPKSQAQ